MYISAYFFVQLADVLSDFLRLSQHFWAHLKLVWEGGTKEIDKYIWSGG